MKMPKILMPLRHLCRMIFAFCLLFAGYLAAQSAAPNRVTSPSSTDITLNTRVEATEVAVDQMVIFHVELSWSGEIGRYKIAPLDQPVLTNLIMEGSGSKNQLLVGPDGPRSLKTITYQLKPLELGMSYVDGMVIRYRDMESGEEDHLQSQRVAVKIVPGLEPGEGNLTAIIYILLLLLFGAALFYFVFQYFRKRKTVVVKNDEAVRDAPEIAYIRELKSALQASGNDTAAAVERLSKLMREYLYHEFAISRSTSSHQEIVAILRKSLQKEEELQQIDELLRQLDVIKFAGAAPDPSQLSTIFGTAEGFLLKRKQLWEAAQEE